MEFPLRATSAIIFYDIYGLKVFHNTYPKIELQKANLGKQFHMKTSRNGKTKLS